MPARTQETPPTAASTAYSRTPSSSSPAASSSAASSSAASSSAASSSAATSHPVSADPLPEPPPLPTTPLDALRAEWDDIRQRRLVYKLQQGEGTSPPVDLTGLALSGGGIRSATFNLGLLQSLASLGLLKHFDYLSTVSGGGFVGGWWSAWLARRDGPPPPDGQAPLPLFPGDEKVDLLRYVEPSTGGPVTAHDDPVHHVRLFSNYLTPKSGLLSPDVWLSAVVVARNLVLTWAVMLPALAIAVLFAQFAFLRLPGTEYLFSPAALSAQVVLDRVLVALILPAAFLGWFVVLSVLWLMLHRGNAGVQGAATTLAVLALTLLSWLTFRRVSVALSWSGWGVVVWLAIALGLIVWVLSRAPGSGPRVRQYEQLRNYVTRYQRILLALSAVSAAILLAAAFGHEVVKTAVGYRPAGGASLWDQAATWALRGLGLLAVVGGVRTWILGAPKGGKEALPDRPPSAASRWLIGIAPGLVLGLLLCLIAHAVYWMAQYLDTHRAVIGPLEAMLQQATLIGSALAVVLAAAERPGISAAPTALALTAVVLTFAAGWLDAQVPGLRSRGWLWQANVVYGLSKAPAAAAFASVVVALLQMRRRRTSRRSVVLMVSAAIATTVISAFTLFNVSSSATTLLVGAMAVMATVTIALGWTADPNNLSLHMFYKGRLVRAYLGASNKQRNTPDQDVSLHIEGDNIALTKLATGREGAPYHLINTTLNLAAASDIVMSQRRAANFVLSRLHCGAARTGYRPTDKYMGGELSLGTAIAVSGAAASPNMGSLTPSTPLVMLMALLNVRLGFWAPTPNQLEWEAPQARLWPVYLLREFFSSTTDQGSYCYLTDGGHFDNTGVYALVERGCRYIVMVDCGADPRTVFDDLSNLVRRCRIDFHAEINLDPLDPLRYETATPERKHFVIGRITYDRAHLQALGWTDRDLEADSSLLSGYIVLVKPTAVPSIAVDIRRYGQKSIEFPQETTTDQWYDEAQFESYRRLGEVSGRAVFTSLMTNPVPSDDSVFAPLATRFGRPREVPAANATADAPAGTLSVTIDTGPTRA